MQLQLPKAVQDAVKTSDELQKQLNETKPNAQQDGTTPLPESGTLPQQGPDTLPKNGVVPQTDPAQQAPDDWEQRYRTLQGKYNAQVPRLQQDIQQLQGKMSALENENTQLKTAVTNQTHDNPGEKSTLDKDAFAAYGEDFGTLVETIQNLESRNDTLADEVKRLSGDVTQDRQTSAQEAYGRYLETVTSQIAQIGGNLKELDSSPQFLNWLRQYPEGEAESRHTKLQRAESSHDAIATVEIFKEYLGATTQQAPNTPPNLQPPNTPPAPAPTNQPEGRMWTRAQISQFYADKVKGVFKGRDEEAAQIEADILAAPTQGRVS